LDHGSRPLSFSPHPSARFSFFPAPPPPDISTLSLHDALPIYQFELQLFQRWANRFSERFLLTQSLRRRSISISVGVLMKIEILRDRKSTRLNSSHVSISYAVFCLKKKKKHH